MYILSRSFASVISIYPRINRDALNTITQHEDEEEKAKARLLASFDYLLNHNGSGHLEVNTKILKRGQKEVTIQCSRSHRFIVDMKEQEGGN